MRGFPRRRRRDGDRRRRRVRAPHNGGPHELREEGGVDAAADVARAGLATSQAQLHIPCGRVCRRTIQLRLAETLHLRSKGRHRAGKVPRCHDPLNLDPLRVAIVLGVLRIELEEQANFRLVPRALRHRKSGQAAKKADANSGGKRAGNLPRALGRDATGPPATRCVALAHHVFDTRVFPTADKQRSAEST